MAVCIARKASEKNCASALVPSQLGRCFMSPRRADASPAGDCHLPLRFVILGLDPRIHAATVWDGSGGAELVIDADLTYGWFWTAGALPRGYGMDPRVSATSLRSCSALG
jgi:hypothetical protein